MNLLLLFLLKCRPFSSAERVRSRIAAAGESSVPVEAFDVSSGVLPARRAMNLCEDLFRDHPGTLIRERCRDEMFAKDESESVRDLVYGEFGFLSLVAFFKKHRGSIPSSNAVCYDLGSGVGRPVFAAATLHPFAKVVGMECLEGLHALGTELAQLYDAEAGGEGIGEGRTPHSSNQFLYFVYLCFLNFHQTSRETWWLSKRTKQ